MLLDDLPHSVLYDLCKYLSLMNIISLSKTCTKLFYLIERNDYFWIKLIKNHFGFKLYHLYVHEIFQNKRNSDYDLYDTEEDREKFEKKFRKMDDMARSGIWLWNVLNCLDNSDAYLSYRRMKKQKSSPRTKNQFKMSLTINELFKHYMIINEYFIEENLSKISFYKLMYVYLIKSKRLSCLNLMPVIIDSSLSRFPYSRRIFSNYKLDIDSSTGQCIRLSPNVNTLELGIKGTFKAILPGIYQIVCRIKLDKNEEYLSYYNEHCSADPGVEKSVECYFYALPDYGIDCECNEQIMNYDWFESNYLLYGNTKWFNQGMGQIQIFHLSNIYFGFKITAAYRYRNILFDYIQLNLIQ